MTDRTCTADGCARSLLAKGLCVMHYARQRPKYVQTKLCTVEGCGKLLLAGGMCPMHYARVRNSGSPDQPQKKPAASAESRFFAKVRQYGDCWLWIAGTTHGGYGVFRDGGRNHVAHRWCYEFMIADIPDGLHLDHLCKVRACVNPYHLDPVPQAVNNQRSDAGKVNSLRMGGATHCQRGHPFDEANTRWVHGGKYRSCRTCHAAAVREGKRRRRAAV